MPPRARILVTGAAGFVGGHLRDALRLAFSDAWLIAAIHRRPAMGWDENVTLDLTDAAGLAAQLSAIAPDAVVHGRSIGSHLDLELLNLTRTFEEMKSDTLTEAARLIAAAPRLWVLGFGAEDGLARHARLSFARLRPDVQMLGTDQGAWAEDLAMTGPRDVLLFLTLEPRLRTLPSLMSYARTTRMNVITLTDHRYFARAQRFSKLVIGCHVASYGTIPSHTTFLSVLRLMAIAFIGQSGEVAQQRLSVIEEINEEIDVFE